MSTSSPAVYVNAKALNAKLLNAIVQVGLVGFTALGFLLTSLELPKYGLAANLTSQIFWLYSSYKAWREANQIEYLLLRL
jgi:hypothetical protein